MMEPHAGNRVMRPGNVRRAAPWILAAALGAMATAILLTLATAGTAKASDDDDDLIVYDFALTSWNNNITLHWNSQAGDIYAYKIRKFGVGSYSQHILDEIPVERHTHTITGLDYGVEYQVYLNTCPPGDPDDWCGRITDTLSIRTAPAAPENLQYTLTAEYDVVLTWDDPHDPSINNYWYRVAASGEEPDWRDWVVASTGPITTYTIPADEITEGVDNEIELSARNHAGGRTTTVTVSLPDPDEVPDPGESPQQPTPAPEQPTPAPQQPTPTPS